MTTYKDVAANVPRVSLVTNSVAASVYHNKFHKSKAPLLQLCQRRHIGSTSNVEHTRVYVLCELKTAPVNTLQLVTKLLFKNSQRMD